MIGKAKLSVVKEIQDFVKAADILARALEKCDRQKKWQETGDDLMGCLDAVKERLEWYGWSDTPKIGRTRR